MLHELDIPLTAHKDRQCTGTPSSCCGRIGQVNGSLEYRMNFPIASLALMLQEQS